MKPIVRNITITVAVIGVIVGAFLIVFLPGTREVKISGVFVNNASAEQYDDMSKTKCTLDVKVTTNLIGNANKAEGTIKIGDDEYTLSGNLFLGEKYSFAVATVESSHKVQYDPVATVDVDTETNKVRINVGSGEHKGYWYGVIESKDDFNAYFGINE